MIVGVIGMGYVGITEAVMLALSPDVDMVYGFQRDSKTSGYKIDLLNSGELPFKEPNFEPSLKTAVSSGKFVCTANNQKIQECDVVIIAVQTPATSRGEPDLEVLYNSLATATFYLKNDAIVVIVSTIPPHTTDYIYKHIISPTKPNVQVVHAPERVMPGNLGINFVKYARIIGSYNEETAERIINLYRSAGVKIHVSMTPIEAEITKTAENAIRAVQIAVANQLAILCDANGANFYNVKYGIDTLYGHGVTRAMLYPGAGVGGHCLPKDGYLLASAMPKDTTSTLFEKAITINDNMPRYLWKLTSEALRCKNIPIAEAKILILGWSYLPESDDIRNSPAIEYKRIAEMYGSTVLVYDPVCKIGIGESTDDIDAFVVITPHNEIRNKIESLLECKPRIIIDGRNSFYPNPFIKRGWTYRGIGRGDL